MTKENERLNENLISVERQSEYSMNTGTREDRVFVKMYVGAVRTGLISDMKARNWTTLCVIASFMDKDGRCYPTQDQIAKGLGVTRQSASKYVNDLLDYRWEGKPVIKAEKVREKGRFANTIYTILPVSFLGIFDNEA